MDNQNAAARGKWSIAKLFLFRFLFVYLVLYNLPFPLGAIPHTDTVLEKYHSLWHTMVPWVGSHILRLSSPITVFSAGSGDTTYDYVLVFCYLVLAVTAAVAWSVLEGSRLEHEKLFQWLRLYVRMSLGAAMFTYGTTKLVQTQFPPPNLTRLLQPFGEASLTDLLWTFMGASRGYNLFTGGVETAAGILLFVPRLATLGAFVAIGAMANVLAINLCYDVPVKLYSFHLLLMAVFLVMPEVDGLWKLLVLKRRAEPQIGPPLFVRRSWNIAVLAAQLLLGAIVFYTAFNDARSIEQDPLGEASHPPFYGIWQVDEFAVNGQVLPPLLTDPDRWQRAVIQFPKGIAIQSMNGEWAGYWLHRDMDKKTFSLDQPNGAKKQYAFVFSTPEPSVLSLSGKSNGKEIRVKLHRLDESKFDLSNTKFRWINNDY